ncbi:signal peptidase I [Aeromicrobium sp. Leaf350]|uniref:signal peptidase I n=1 Tax=Aeromicrobium sp. Leaf350 TaxID=2876565 RepID=UPI001E368890|nr:signal peptidase I [Aeromicrobium sp. Leaf350]
MSRHLARPARSHRSTDRPDRRRRGVLRLAVALGVLAILATGLAWAAGVKPLVFTSGSMSPSIPTGSLAFSRTVDAGDLAVGDVVSVENDRDERVTHRVVAAQLRGDEAVLVLQGDANSTTDPEPYVVTSAERVDVSVPVLGRVVTALDGRSGVAVLVASGVVLVLLLRRPASSHHRSGRASSGGPVATMSVGALVAAGALVLGAMPTQAYWTDVATATSGTFTTVAPTPTPAGATCSDTGDHVLVGWNNVGQRYRYQLSLHRLDGTQVGDVTYVNAATTASVASEVQRATFPASTSGALNFQLRVRAVPNGSTTWLSPTPLTIAVRYTPGYTQLRCGNDTTTTVSIDSIGSDSNVPADLVTNVKANTIVGQGEPGSTIVVRRNGVPLTDTATVTAGGTWSLPVSLVEGSASYDAVATDPYGNTATSAVRTVVLDTIAPTATQAAPCATANVGNAVAGTTWCKVTSLAWTATFTDNAGGSGVPAAGQQYTNNADTVWLAYSGTVPMPETNGRKMQARATDLAGNVSPIASGTYYIDGTAPTITVTAPTPTNYANANGLRTAVTDACGANRVACGTVTETVSGVAASPTAQWSLRRTDTFLFLVPSTVCLNGNAYSSACSATYPITVSGSTFSIASGNATSATIYPNRAGLTTAMEYRLTVTGLTDAAGNVGANTVVEFTY